MLTDRDSKEGAVDVYKYLLCWRYLRTRYIALASVISVMLGVATMIVVNSVMAGFAERCATGCTASSPTSSSSRYDLDGFYNSDEVMARIKEVAGDDVVAMAPTMETSGHAEVPRQRRVWSPARSRSSASGPRSGPRPATSPSSSFDEQGPSRSRRRSRSPRRCKQQTPAGADAQGLRGRPERPVRQAASRS